MYTLTDEGERYLRRGLPEKRLLRALDKARPLSQLQNLEDFKIGLQWAKKRGWLTIDKGQLIPKSRPGELPEEHALKQISEHKPVDDHLITVLLKRRLIKQEREDVTKRAEKQLATGVTSPTPELIKSGLWKKTTFKPYNVQAAGRIVYPGKRHPYHAYLHRVRQQLVELGFQEMTGPSIETEFWNFDALFQPQNHPSRDWTQTYSLKAPAHGSLPAPALVKSVKHSHEKNWGYQWDPKKAARLMPRAHSTALSARTLADNPDIPGKYFSISRCFRPDVIDATHGVEFNQVDGMVIGDLTFRDLLGLLKGFAREFAGAEKIKFLPDYYPFTECSVQLSAKHPKLGWIELAGAGIFREELTRPLGITKPVLAWGIGIDRLAMFKLGIDDIRQLFSRDLSWLRSTEVMI